MNTPDLFQPTEIECAGDQLADVLASIESRGGMVQRLEVVSVSGYWLMIVWPIECPHLAPLRGEPSSPESKESFST